MDSRAHLSAAGSLRGSDVQIRLHDSVAVRFARKAGRQYIFDEARRFQKMVDELTGRCSGDDIPSYIMEATNKFIDLSILMGRDDEDAEDAAISLIYALDGFARGTVPDLFLYRHALGPRVRSALLKESWTTGKSGSPLCLCRRGRDTLCEYFRESEERFLMDDHESAELARLRSVGQSITVYRGARLKPEGVRRQAMQCRGLATSAWRGASRA